MRMERTVREIAGDYAVLENECPLWYPGRIISNPGIID